MLIADTLEFVRLAHMWQRDKAGKPYYLHPFRVMLRLLRPTEDMRHAALLHDVVEDTEFGLDALKKMGYSPGVLTMVDLLTRREGQSHNEYMKRLIDSGNYNAMLVKLADVHDNSSPSRLAGLPESERGLEKRYQRDVAMLAEVILKHQARNDIPVIAGDM